MKDFAREFYLSPEWKKVRKYIYDRDYGLCRECGNVGEIVHHIIPITRKNIKNDDITLNEQNLILVCRKCHGMLHGDPCVGEGMWFDEGGNLNG